MSFMQRTRIGMALLGATILAGMATASCGVALGQSHAQAGGNTAARVSASATSTWPARMVLSEPAKLNVVSQVIDPRAKSDFALTSAGHGTFTLRRTGLASGQVKTGRSFPVDSLALASGSLWVFGALPAGPTAERMRLYQVSTQTLHVERTITLGPSHGASGLAALAAGMHGTIWVSFGRTILHLTARTGATIGAIRLPAGLVAGDIALSPSGRFLYVATSPPVGGGHAPVFEYQTASLRKLAVNKKTVVAANVGGGTPTATPGGVWVSARGGMEGRTVLLRQQSLRPVRLPGTGSPHGLYSWVMSQSTMYSSPSLYLATYPIQSRGGVVAGCVNPKTGHILARGSIAGHRAVDQLLGVGHNGLVLYAAVPHGVIAIRPPAACRA
jgi:hypothetical protein